MAKENLNPLVSAQHQIKVACEKLGLSDSVYELLKEPNRVLEVSIPVKMDDGSVKVFKGFRSQHSDAVGPTKGGIRFHPNVSRDEVKALSIWMSFKCSVTGIPYGGGKGGIIVDPKTLSDRELEQLSRGFVRKIYRYIGETSDVPAPDVNTNGQIMAWMQDEYNVLTGSQGIGTFTGKPITLGGSQGRNEATGLGVAVITKEALETKKIDIKGATVAVQGFGNVGSFTVKNLESMGAKVVAVMEHTREKGSFAVYNKEGFRYEELNSFEDKGDFTKLGDEISPEDFWKLDVDVIIPAALENAITEDVAKTLQCKIIVEAANGPLTTQADAVCKEKGIFVVPDILANAGGVTVSYFEWVQNRYGYYWTEEVVQEREEELMVQAYNNILKVYNDYDCTFREASYMYSIQKIAEAMKLKGLY